MTPRTRWMTAVVGILALVGGSSAWLWLRPPAGVRIAWQERPHLRHKTSRLRYLHLLTQSLSTPPRTTTELFRQTDAWGIFAGLAALKPTASTLKPLPAPMIARLKRLPWSGPVPTTPEALSVAASTVASTATLTATAQWVQNALPETGIVTTSPAGARPLAAQWMAVLVAYLRNHSFNGRYSMLYQPSV